MTNATHTGWHQTATYNSHGAETARVIRDVDGKYICSIIWDAVNHTDNEDAEKSAHLIAEAPELLNVLKKMVDAWSKGDTSNFESLMLEAQASIAKAEGK